MFLGDIRTMITLNIVEDGVCTSRDALTRMRKPDLRDPPRLYYRNAHRKY